MLDYVYGTLIVFLWIGLLVGPFLLFLLRLSYVISHNQKGSQGLKVLFLPCSIGFFLVEKEPTRMKRIYEWILSINFVCLLLGSLFILYLRIL